MRLITIKFFATGKGICGDDFKNKDMETKINPRFILSLTPLRMFTLPFSDRQVRKYAVLTMSNNDKYYLREESYLFLNDAISK